jgi:hypothetical protein
MASMGGPIKFMIDNARTVLVVTTPDQVQVRTKTIQRMV